MAIRANLAILLLATAVPAQAQDTRDETANAAADPQQAENPQPIIDRDTMNKAKDIVLQPAEDVGIKKAEIPPVLAGAAEAPYAMPARGCRAVQASLTELNEALGPDLDVTEEGKANVAGRLAEAGGAAVVNSLIPFRGLVREISGAAPAERRLQSAVEAGLARRGFLRGLAASRGCKVPDGVPAAG